MRIDCEGCKLIFTALVCSTCCINKVNLSFETSVTVLCGQSSVGGQGEAALRPLPLLLSGHRTLLRGVDRGRPERLGAAAVLRSW